MSKFISLFIFLILLNQELICQSYEEEIKKFQNDLNQEMLDPEESPLSKKERKKFKGLPFFDIHEKYKVESHFERTPDSKPFKMKTTTSRRPTYEKYGEATFMIDGIEYKLNIYQSHRLRETEEYKSYLFLPFTDLTSGSETYGGGRYIDLSIPDGDQLIIDFNKSYNPTCAYNDAYSCPVPPRSNRLQTKILAGIKYKEK